MDVAIIGAGNVGKALAGSLARTGNSVTITAKDAEHAQAAADQTGARSAKSNQEAVEGAEAVILAVPNDAIGAVLDDLGDELGGKIVIDVTNRVNLDDPGSVLDGRSNAEHIQSRLPAAWVIKAFNTAFSVRQSDPVVDGMPADGFVAGDDEEAKRAVLDLVEAVGFRPIDAGPLVMARALEAMGLLIISLQVRHGWQWQNAWRLIGPMG
jgi:8-hydroxy-5-deazaflavin:NADPH oxidoreductase